MLFQGSYVAVHVSLSDGLRVPELFTDLTALFLFLASACLMFIVRDYWGF